MNHQELFKEISQKQKGSIQIEVEKDFRDLMEENPNSIIFRFYKKANSKTNSRAGRIRKFPFFIYWLGLRMKNPKWETIDGILEDIWAEYPDLIPARDPDGFSFKYSKKIRTRYRKSDHITEALAGLAIEQTPFSKQYLNILKGLELHLASQPPPEDFEVIILSLLESVNEHPELMEIIKSAIATPSGHEVAKEILERLRIISRELNFKQKLLNYLTQRKKVSLREIQRRFSKRKSDIMSSLRYLKRTGIISQDKITKEIIFMEV